MPKPSVKPTTAGNLEPKFDAGDDVLDYFDVEQAKAILPRKVAAPTAAAAREGRGSTDYSVKENTRGSQHVVRDAQGTFRVTGEAKGHIAQKAGNKSVDKIGQKKR